MILRIFICFFALMLCGFVTPSLAAEGNDLDEQLIYRVNLGRADDVELLLNKGANIHATNDSDWSLLVIASSRRDKEAVNVVDVLVKKGAKINQRDKAGNYPLISAIRVGNEDVVRYLLDNGADFYVRDPQGLSVLANAEKTDNTRIIGMINQAIEDLSKKVKMEHSVIYRNRLIQEYAFLNCTLQYLGYCESTRLPVTPKTLLDAAQINSRKKRAQEITQVLQTNFRFPPNIIRAMAQSSMQTIFNELENYISTRNRIVHGVGKQKDMETRCLKISKANLKNFEKAQEVYKQKKLEEQGR